MNPKNTWVWVTIAAILFSVILVLEKFGHKPPAGPIKVLPGLKAADIKTILVRPKGQRAVEVERTNGGWRLTEPAYPANGQRIEHLLAVLEQLTASPYLSPAEVKKLANADEQFGFDPPQSSLLIGEKNFHVLIGNKTAMGDQVYVQVVAAEGVYVVDAEVLKFIPDQADQWRDRELADWNQLKFDRLTVTNAGKILELHIDPAGQFWRMVHPMQTRADGEKVQTSLQRLSGLRVRQFVSDLPKPDLESFGLQNPELSLGFFQGTNRMLLFAFGKSPTNDPQVVYARRDDQNTIVTVSKDALEPWLAAQSQEFRYFMDRHLVFLSQVPNPIEVIAQDHFSLQAQTNGVWRVQPQDFPVDMIKLQEFIDQLTHFKFTEIAREVVLEQDLPTLSTYGLKPPGRQYILKATDPDTGDGATNHVLAQLDFGIHEDKVFARRAGEDFVFAIDPVDLDKLPFASWQLRDRQIWKFLESDIARITVHQGGKTRDIIHQGTNSWSLAPGSQGIINEFALEETAHQFADLYAAEWVGCGDFDRAKYGFAADGHQVAIELKDGRKFSVEFGIIAPSGRAYALTQLDQKPWVFEFPPVLFYKYVRSYLTIPANVP